MSAQLRFELAPVRSVDDPLRLGRVQVTFADGLVSDWLQLASPFAGSGYGMFALPQTDAHALVAFATDDRSIGYVMGFAWDGEAKPLFDDPVRQKQVWTVRTKNKSITLDDSETSSIEIADEKKNLVRIDTKKNEISIVSEGDLSINAKGTITLQGDKIVVKGTRNVTIEGNEIDLNAQEG